MRSAASELVAAARRGVYWALDRTRGGGVAAAVADVHARMDDPRSPTARAVHDARLRAIVEHAIAHTDFYRGRPADLVHLPVVDKRTFREQGAAMLARDADRSALVVHRTSGSTGTPFEALWDEGKVLRNRADTIALAERAGYRLGTTIVYLRNWTGQYGKGRWQRLKEGLVPVEAPKLDLARARDLVGRLRRRGAAVMLLGYGSALEQLCRAVEVTGPDLGGLVVGVVAVGEASTAYLREAAPRAFGRPLVARYSNTENGLIAQEAPGETVYRINVASYHVEILRHDSDEPAAPGEEGRIVLTDLWNRGMPFLRYDTGDVGAFAVDEHGAIDDTVLASVSGRVLDRILDAEGRPVYPLSMEILELSVRQYQLAQTGPGEYALRLNAQPDDERDARILDVVHALLGPTAAIRVEHVQEVPLLASGKRRIMVNEWRPGP